VFGPAWLLFDAASALSTDCGALAGASRRSQAVVDLPLLVRAASPCRRRTASFIAVMTGVRDRSDRRPLLVGAVAQQPHGFAAALLAAAIVLLRAATSLWRSAPLA